MNRSTLARRISKTTTIVVVISMCFLAFEVIVGFTKFYVNGLTWARLTAFVVVVLFPIIFGIALVLLNRRSYRSALGLILTVVALLCDLALLSFANGRL